MPTQQSKLMNQTLIRAALYVSVFFLIQFFSFQYEGPAWLETVGVVTFFLGITLYAVGLNNISIRNAYLESSQKLVTSGIYSIFRHPLYIAISVTYLGASIWNQSIVGLLATVLVLIPTLFYFAIQEEKELMERFGDEYINYKKRTLI